MSSHRWRDVEALYFTFDIDGLDPAHAPGTGTPEAGGPSTRDWLTFARIDLRIAAGARNGHRGGCATAGCEQHHVLSGTAGDL